MSNSIYGESSKMPKIPADRYKIIEKLGEGGMGTVVKASHARINKLVAIKILNTNSKIDEVSIRRFEMEANAGGQLSHPNLVSIFDYGITEDGEPYLVMEYVDGESLQTYLEDNGTISSALFQHVFEQLVKALQYIHGEGIVHRDIKTSNIMLQSIGDDIYAKLLDFGIAKVFQSSGAPAAQQLTATGVIMGSPLYMSPEQCMGRDTDARSDIYALGCVMYECIAGRPPFIGDNILHTFFLHMNEAPKPLAALNSEDPHMRAAARIALKCLEKNPADRYQTSSELLKALVTLQKANAPSAAGVQKISPMKSAENNRAGLSSSISTAGSATGNRWKKVERSEPGEPALCPEPVPAAQTHSGELGLSKEKTESDTNENFERNAELQRLTASHLRRNTEERALHTPQPQKTKPNFMPALGACFAGVVVLGAIWLALPFLHSNVQQLSAGHELEEAERLFAAGSSSWADAKQKYTKALEASTQGKDSSASGKILVRLGRINLFGGELAESESNYKKGLACLDRKKPENRELILDALLGRAELESRQKRFGAAAQILANAETLSREWHTAPQRQADILLASARNEVSNSDDKEALHFYEMCIAQYGKLETPPAENLSRAWLESAAICKKMGWTQQMKRRAEQSTSIAAKITDSTVRDDVQSRAAALIALAPSTEPTTPSDLAGSPGSFVPLPPGGNPPPVMPSNVTATDVQITTGKNTLAEQQLEQIRRAQELNKQLSRYQKENYSNVVRQLQSQSQAMPAGSNDEY